MICFFLIICIIVTAISGYKKLLSALGLKTEHSIREEKIDRELIHLQTEIDSIKEKIKDQQTSIIKKQEEYHQQSVAIRGKLGEGQNELKNELHMLKDMIAQFTEDQNKSTVAMLRSSLWRLHKDFTAQGFVTPDGLKTFIEMGKVYENAGGDDIYHEKLLPEVEGLDIHYPNGSIYNPSKANRV